MSFFIPRDPRENPKILSCRLQLPGSTTKKKREAAWKCRDERIERGGQNRHERGHESIARRGYAGPPRGVPLHAYSRVVSPSEIHHRPLPGAEFTAYRPLVNACGAAAAAAAEAGVIRLVGNQATWCGTRRRIADTSGCSFGRVRRDLWTRLVTPINYRDGR